MSASEFHGSPVQDRGPIAFAERLITLIDQGRSTATYKYALLLALMDVCMEQTTARGEAPRQIHTRDLARRIVELYWPQTAEYVSTEGPVTLRQNARGQAEIVSLIADFRGRYMPDPSAPLSHARVARPNAFERLLRRVEWKLIAMPIPRLQLVGQTYEPFVYRIGWTTDVTAGLAAGPGFDRRLHLAGRAGDYLVQLAGLLRPLIEAKWIDLVLRFNQQALHDAGLADFLFGSHRVSTGRLNRPLRELQDNRCFYCGSGMRGAAHVDHFLPWARWPDNGVENLVAAHPGCNSQKRDFIAAAVHLEKWARRFDPAGGEWRDLEAISAECNWDRHPERTYGVARSLYLRLPDQADLWVAGSEFVAPEWETIRFALAAVPDAQHMRPRGPGVTRPK